MNRFTFCISLSVLVVAFFSGCREKNDEADIKVPRLMIETRGVNYGSMLGRPLTLPISGTRLQVENDPLVSEFDISNVELVEVDLGLALLVQLSEKGARDFYRGIVTNMGGRVVLTVNGNALGARRVVGLDEALQGGDFYTFVELDDEELGDLVLDMQESLLEIHSSI